MVKSITTLVCSLLVMLSVSSCRKELEHSPSGSGCVTFTPSGTRSTQEGTFEKSDAIGVFAIEPKSGVYWATNNKYTYDGRTFKPATEEDNIIVTVGTDLTFMYIILSGKGRRTSPPYPIPQETSRRKPDG